jgi:hypothetical protein
MRIRRRKRFSRRRVESVLPKHVELAGPSEGLGTVRDLELAVDVARVGLDGAHGDEEILGDLRIGSARSEQAQHLELALTQRFFE